MRVAVAQIACLLGDVEANLRKVRDFCSRAADQGAAIIVFPEMIDTGYSMPVIREMASSWEAGPIAELRNIAIESSIEVVSGISERVGEDIFNSQVHIDRSGEIVGSYRKTHLFTPPPIQEDTCFCPGARLVSYSAGQYRIGLSICYDLRFPEVYRSLACGQGANLFVISSAWPFPRVEHFRVLLRARAIENQSYVVAANRVGTDDGVTFCGSSTVIDPTGTVVAAAYADREQLLHAELSYELIQSVRSQMPVFAHRRQELYSRTPPC